MTQDEIQAVARAMCLAGGFDPDEIMPNDGPRWGYYTDGAQAAIAALDAARGDPVVRVVEFIREQQANAHRHMLEAAHRKTASLFAAAFVTLRNLVDAIERGEPFNG